MLLMKASRLRAIIAEALDLRESRISDARLTWDRAWELTADEGMSAAALEDMRRQRDEWWRRVLAGQPAGSNNKYVPWIARMVAKAYDPESGPEHAVDLEDLLPAVHDYHAMVPTLARDERDVNRFATGRELIDFVDDRQKAAVAKKATPAKKVLDNDAVTVVKVADHAQSCKYGANTKWCVAARDPKQWTAHAEGGSKFYYVIDKVARKKWAVELIGPDDGGTLYRLWDDEDNRVRKVEHFFDESTVGLIALKAIKADLNTRWLRFVGPDDDFLIED